MSTPTVLLRKQFGMEGQEHTSSTQEVEKTKLASLPAEAEALKTAAAHIEVSTHASHSVVLTECLVRPAGPSVQ